jgi:hypothetical protein
VSQVFSFHQRLFGGRTHQGLLHDPELDFTAGLVFPELVNTVELFLEVLEPEHLGPISFTVSTIGFGVIIGEQEEVLADGLQVAHAHDTSTGVAHSDKGTGDQGCQQRNDGYDHQELQQSEAQGGSAGCLLHVTLQVSHLRR